MMDQFKYKTGQFGIRFLYMAKIDRLGRISRWVCVKSLPDFPGR